MCFVTSTKAALAVDPTIEAIDLAAAKLAVDLVLLLFNEIFLLPHLQALTGLDNVLCKPISLRYKELLCAAEHALTRCATRSIPPLASWRHNRPPGNDLEMRQTPILNLEGLQLPRGYDLRGGDHCPSRKT